MKNILFILIGFFVMINVFAQNPGDTIIVQTFDYSSNTRDTIAYFPNDTNLTFEKIILLGNIIV